MSELLVDTALSALVGTREGIESVAAEKGYEQTLTLGQIIRLLRAVEDETRESVAEKLLQIDAPTPEPGSLRA